MIHGTLVYLCKELVTTVVSRAFQKAHLSLLLAESKKKKKALSHYLVEFMSSKGSFTDCDFLCETFKAPDGEIMNFSCRM